MQRRNIQRGMLIILLSNILNMVCGLIIGFVLPKLLSVNSYASIKTYQLYLSYIGLFHLGYVDGIYLRYGGKTIDTLDRAQLSVSLSTIRIFQFVIAVFLFAISAIFHNGLLMIFSADLFSFNLLSYYKSIFQAIGNYHRYAKITNYITFLNFFINMVLVLIVKTDNPYLYVMGYAIVDFAMCIWFEIKVKRLFEIIAPICAFNFGELKANIQEGILLLLGNFTSVILTSMDRWFTKILLTTFDFALFSFAVSIENFLNVAITPVSVTMYNYFCSHTSEREIRKARNYAMILSTIIVSAFFPVKFMLDNYLTEYLDSTDVIILLFASQMLYIVIKSIYVNLYKSFHMQKKYFKRVVSIVLIGFVLNTLFYMIRPTKESFAFGTLCSSIIWFLLCQFDFKECKLSKREAFYEMAEVIGFLFIAYSFSSLSGLVIYIIYTSAITMALLKNELKELCSIAGSFLRVTNSNRK